jgi:uncharacterized protein
MNHMGEYLHSVEDIVERLKALDPEKIILFGSQASEEADDESDIDVAVIKETSLPFHERLIEARRLLRTTRPVDVFVFTSAEIEENSKDNPFIREIVTAGKVVYGG